MSRVFSWFTTRRVILSLLLIFFLLLFANLSVGGIERKKLRDERKIAEEERIREEKKIYLLGHFDPALHDDFVPVPKEYNLTANTIYLRKETLEAFTEMAEAAREDSITLKLASATRNFDYQKNLWDKKWSGTTLVEGKNLMNNMPDESERFEKILEYSAAPGISRHHWGTDIDINNANPAYFSTTKGKREYEWLIQNAHVFGFCQTYNEKGLLRPTGYNEEKWHWSYMPLAKTFLEEYKELIKTEDIKGFFGDQYVKDSDLINNYVLSINPECF